MSLTSSIAIVIKYVFQTDINKSRTNVSSPPYINYHGIVKMEITFASKIGRINQLLPTAALAIFLSVTTVTALAVEVGQIQMEKTQPKAVYVGAEVELNWGIFQFEDSSDHSDYSLPQEVRLGARTYSGTWSVETAKTDFRDGSEADPRIWWGSIPLSERGESSPRREQAIQWLKRFPVEQRAIWTPNQTVRHDNSRRLKYIEIALEARFLENVQVTREVQGHETTYALRYGVRSEHTLPLHVFAHERKVLDTAYFQYTGETLLPAVQAQYVDEGTQLDPVIETLHSDHRSELYIMPATNTACQDEFVHVEGVRTVPDPYLYFDGRQFSLAQNKVLQTFDHGEIPVLERTGVSVVFSDHALRKGLHPGFYRPVNENSRILMHSVRGNEKYTLLPASEERVLIISIVFRDTIQACIEGDPIWDSLDLNAWGKYMAEDFTLENFSPKPQVDFTDERCILKRSGFFLSYQGGLLTGRISSESGAEFAEAHFADSLKALDVSGMAIDTLYLGRLLWYTFPEVVRVDLTNTCLKANPDEPYGLARAIGRIENFEVIRPSLDLGDFGLGYDYMERSTHRERKSSTAVTLSGSEVTTSSYQEVTTIHGHGAPPCFLRSFRDVVTLSVEIGNGSFNDLLRCLRANLVSLSTVDVGQCALYPSALERLVKVLGNEEFSSLTSLSVPLHYQGWSLGDAVASMLYSLTGRSYSYVYELSSRNAILLRTLAQIPYLRTLTVCIRDNYINFSQAANACQRVVNHFRDANGLNPVTVTASFFTYPWSSPHSKSAKVIDDCDYPSFDYSDMG